MRALIRIVAAAAAALAVHLFGDSGIDVAAQTTLTNGFVEDVVLSGLTNPTAVRFSPDGRVFVAEKSGIIKIFDSLSDSSPTVFADLRTNVHDYWDRGLFGLALDPGFPIRPYVYLFYTYDGPMGGTAPSWGLPDMSDQQDRLNGALAASNRRVYVAAAVRNRRCVDAVLVARQPLDWILRRRQAETNRFGRWLHPNHRRCGGGSARGDVGQS